MPADSTLAIDSARFAERLEELAGTVRAAREPGQLAAAATRVGDVAQRMRVRAGHMRAGRALALALATDLPPAQVAEAALCVARGTYSFATASDLLALAACDGESVSAEAAAILYAEIARRLAEALAAGDGAGPAREVGVPCR